MTKHKEPSDAAVLAARIMRAYFLVEEQEEEVPSPYTAASLAERLCAIERAQEKHVLKGVNGDYIRQWQGGVRLHDDEKVAEERIVANVGQWKADLGMPCELVLGFEPGGPMISLKLPGEPEAVTV